MNRRIVLIASGAMVVGPSIALAFVGADPVTASGIAACSYSEIRAHIGPDKAVSYEVYGTCGHTAVSGELDFRRGVFQERFIFGNAKISTIGYCDTDPWATAVNCHDQQVQSTAVRFNPDLRWSAPLSLVGGSPQAFHDAYLHASRPNPPGVPVNFVATTDAGEIAATWIAPDSGGDRPFLGFLLQARPRDAEGAAISDLVRLDRGETSGYKVTARLPSPGDWDVRVCATTALASSCTPFLAPRDVKVEVVRAGARVKATAPAGPPIPICDAAGAARDRNSPVAANLAAQCIAAGGTLPRAAGLPDADELAARGEAIAGGDERFAALRELQMEGPARRGFDIGLGAAAGQTAWGPGKQRMMESLSPVEQEGFKVAVSLSLDANRNADLAARGAAIAEVDDDCASARRSVADPRYALGFDIATAIFGDPALGALGNTSLGPGSLEIRNALSRPAQQGFDAAVALHLEPAVLNRRQIDGLHLLIADERLRQAAGSV